MMEHVVNGVCVCLIQDEPNRPTCCQQTITVPILLLYVWTKAFTYRAVSDTYRYQANLS